ncbi:MAG: hypothetical protein K6C12_12960 [Oscillospiraceae bacterium]|nr:hypothetical protein [Oscillospiraceae bacterium]
MGVPEMEQFWNELSSKVKSGAANKEEIKLYKKLGKAMKLISQNPRHPGLETHEISSLSKRYGEKVWQSYLENKTPAAGRLFWSYGPERGDITIIGLEPHPNDKSNAYDKITLSAMGEVISN